MSEVLDCKRELIVDKPADQVWDYISNLRNAMTANQFHLSIDCADAVARAPRTGLEVPILHEIMGHRAYRIARITRFEDYSISWGERIPDDATYEDSFPHSEGWKIESLGSNRCRIQNHLRGRWMLPVGQLIGRHSWDIIIPPILDTSIYDEVVTVTSEEALTYARLSARLEGVPVGISSGGAIAAALKVGRKPQWAGKNIVIIIPSFAERYLSTALFEGLDT